MHFRATPARRTKFVSEEPRVLVSYPTNAATGCCLGEPRLERSGGRREQRPRGKEFMISFSNTAARLGVSVAGLIVGLVLGCNNSGEEDSAGGACVAGQQNYCSCPGDPPTAPTGVQVCNAAGTYDPCQCGPVGTGGETDDSDDSNASMSDSQSDTSTGDEPDLCGNGFADPGECSNPDGGVGFCPEDCVGATTGSDTDADTDTDDSATGDESSTGVVDVCEGMPIYVSNIPNNASQWMNMGVMGFGAGRAMCMAAGADDVCTYSMLVEAEMQGDFVANPPAAGTTFWVHRVAATTYNGVMIQPSAASRCLDWTYGTNHISDGEYATFGAGGAITYTLDPDPMDFDPNAMQCGPEMRAIPCCNVCP